jgi:hypothetical protein
MLKYSVFIHKSDLFFRVHLTLAEIPTISNYQSLLNWYKCITDLRKHPTEKLMCGALGRADSFSESNFLCYLQYAYEVGKARRF